MMNTPLEAQLQTSLAELNNQQALRRLTPIQSNQQAGCLQHPNGNWLINASGNDYLGLSQHPKLKQASHQAIEQWGVGAGASRLVVGSSQLHQALEAKLCEFKKAEAALLFNSGYQANVTLLQALCGKDDLILADKLNHASLVDGCLLSGAQWSRYQHANLSHLESKLKKAKSTLKGNLWIVTDSLFSMDGDTLDLKALVELASQYGAYTYIDEAHATGLFGKTHSGLAEHYGVTNQLTVQMGTFSKALGGAGGYAVASKALIEWVINKGRGFVYSTALPPAVVASNLASLTLLQTNCSPTQQLWHNVQQFKQCLAQYPKLAPYLTANSASQIIPFITKDNAKTLQASQRLQELGCWVSAIRPPTVPPNTARLRVSISASHSHEQLQQLARALNTVLSDL
jgi:8-amino-7-oxononanoate synthase